MVLKRKKKLITKRLHDKLYINENRYNLPKLIFKDIAKKIKYNYFNKTIKIADVGCATGEFCFYLKKVLPKSDIYGFDVLDTLLKKAREKVKDVKFFNKSILSKKFGHNKKFDVVTCLGVVGIFDSFEDTILNLLKITKPGGKIYLQALINDYDLNINIRYSYSKNWIYRKPKYWETGWNIFSKRNVINFLKKKKVKFKMYKNIIKYDQKINNSDHMRSWTVKLNGKKKLINGLNFIIPEYIIEIVKKK